MTMEEPRCIWDGDHDRVTSPRPQESWDLIESVIYGQMQEIQRQFRARDALQTLVDRLRSADGFPLERALADAEHALALTEHHNDTG
jgi:hypothetical protein